MRIWKRERHKRFDEKSKLDNARRFRPIYFIDFEDKEFKETIKNAHKKLETPMAFAGALQDKQDMQAWCDPWQNQWD